VIQNARYSEASSSKANLLLAWKFGTSGSWNLGMSFSGRSLKQTQTY